MMTLKLITVNYFISDDRWSVVYHVPMKFLNKSKHKPKAQLGSSRVLIPEILIFDLYIILLQLRSDSVSVLYFLAPKSKLFWTLHQKFVCDIK